PAREQIIATGLGRPRRMSIAPKLVIPINDLSARERSLGLHDHGWPILLPAELLISHPLQSYPTKTHSPCVQGCVEADVVGAVMSVTARTFGMDAADIGDRQLQAKREMIAERKGPLRMGPHRHLVVFEFGERA